METATKTVDQLSESFSQPTMQERYHDWHERAVSSAKKEQKEEKSGPREISLKDRDDEERRFIEQVGERPPDESKDSAKESRRESSAERDAANKSGKPDAKADEKAAASEPLSGDRHWQAVEGKVVFDKKESDAHWKQVDSRVGVAVEFMDKHPEKAQMEQGFRAIFAGKTPAQSQAFFRDLSMALAEVPNPGEVLHHITVQPEDRKFLSNVKNWKELRAAIQTVAKHYPAPASQASPKPRAPKPPPEVGGRGAAGDDGTRGEMDFSSFSKKMDQQYARRAR